MSNIETEETCLRLETWKSNGRNSPRTSRTLEDSHIMIMRSVMCLPGYFRGVQSSNRSHLLSHILSHTSTRYNLNIYTYVHVQNSIFSGCVN